MNKKWKLIELILNGEKIIESRWYKNKIAPWNKVKKGDIVFFKNSGEEVTAKATVSNVLQFENLDQQKIKEIIQEYGKRIGLRDWNEKGWYNGRNYCILVFLENPEKVESFKINKKGFGISAAWMCVGDINNVKLSSK